MGRFLLGLPELPWRLKMDKGPIFAILLLSELFTF
jgi:hypothetical protein